MHKFAQAIKNLRHEGVYSGECFNGPTAVHWAGLSWNVPTLIYVQHSAYQADRHPYVMVLHFGGEDVHAGSYGAAPTDKQRESIAAALLDSCARSKNFRPLVVKALQSKLQRSHSASKDPQSLQDQAAAIIEQAISASANLG